MMSAAPLIEHWAPSLLPRHASPLAGPRSALEALSLSTRDRVLNLLPALSSMGQQAPGPAVGVCGAALRVKCDYVVNVFAPYTRGTFLRISAVLQYSMRLRPPRHRQTGVCLAAVFAASRRVRQHRGGPLPYVLTVKRVAFHCREVMIVVDSPHSAKVQS